jgi:hypothetical protein
MVQHKPESGATIMKVMLKTLDRLVQDLRSLAARSSSIFDEAGLYAKLLIGITNMFIYTRSRSVLSSNLKQLTHTIQVDRQIGAVSLQGGP